MAYGIIDFFTDPILRAPMLGSLFMCAAASLIGVCVFVRRKSLVGEMLSHAAYPGLVLSAILVSGISACLQEWFSLFFLLGAFISSMLGLLLLRKLQTSFSVRNDAALCFILSSFFGIGVLFASRLQFSHPTWYRHVQVFLYGQTATLLDVHVWIYAAFFVAVTGFLLFFYHHMQISYFDPLFARSLGMAVQRLDLLFFILLGLGVTTAMKSVGVVLLSGMLIAPALAARQFTHKLSKLFVLSCCFGILSAFLGNYLSVKITDWVPGHKLLFPTGPMIVLCGSLFAFVSLWLSSRKKAASLLFYQKKEIRQHLEKVMLRALAGTKEGLTVQETAAYLQRSGVVAWSFLRKATNYGFVKKEGNNYQLTADGKHKVEENKV